MATLPATAVCRVATLAAHMTSYMAAAIYTNFSAAHHDVCPFYACAAVAALFNLGVAVVEEYKKCRQPIERFAGHPNEMVRRVIPAPEPGSNRPS